MKAMTNTIIKLKMVIHHVLCRILSHTILPRHPIPLPSLRSSPKPRTHYFSCHLRLFNLRSRQYIHHPNRANLNIRSLVPCILPLPRSLAQ
jgi:hypothetical protein